MGRKPFSLLTAVALSLLFLAGCAEEGSAGQEGTQDAELPTPGEVEVTETTGGIRGVVVDMTINPIEGATVTVNGVEESIVTDETGTFVFSGLEAGAYFVTAKHPLYGEVQSGVEVEAGVKDPPSLKLQMEKLYSMDPYAITLFHKGHVICSTNIDGVGYSEECGEGVGLPGSGDRVGRLDGSQPQIWFRIDGPNVTTIIVEQAWEPSVSVGTGNTEDFYTRLAIDWKCTPFCGGKSLGTKTDKSPLLLRVDFETLEPHALTVDTNLSTFVYSGASNGVLLDQPYEQFVTLFHILEAPLEWTYIGGSPKPF